MDEFRRLVGINSAAILLSGVGEEKSHQSASVNRQQGHANVSMNDMTHFFSGFEAKLNLIDEKLSKLCPLETGEDGSQLVIQCHHHQQQQEAETSSKQQDLSIDYGEHILLEVFKMEDNLKKYAVVVGSVALLSGLTVAVSFFFR